MEFFQYYLPLSNTFCLVFTTTRVVVRALSAEPVAAHELFTVASSELFYAMELHEAPTAAYISLAHE